MATTYRVSTWDNYLYSFIHFNVLWWVYLINPYTSVYYSYSAAFLCLGFVSEMKLLTTKCKLEVSVEKCSTCRLFFGFVYLDTKLLFLYFEYWYLLLTIGNETELIMILAAVTCGYRLGLMSEHISRKPSLVDVTKTMLTWLSHILNYIIRVK